MIALSAFVRILGRWAPNNEYARGLTGAPAGDISTLNEDWS